MSNPSRRAQASAPPPFHRPPTPLARLDVWLVAHARSAAVVLYIVAAGLRLLYLLDFRHTLLAHVPLMDEAFYRDEARSIVHGAPPTSDAYFMTPLYPLFLSLVFRLVGDGTIGPYAVQLALGALAAPITFLVARRALRPVLAALAGLAVASFAPLVFFEGLFLVEGLVLLFLEATLLFAVTGPRRLSHAALSGAFLGLAVLGRGSNLLLVLPLAAWFLMHRDVDGRGAARRVAFFALAGGLVLTPLFVRNAMRTGRPFLLTANGGFNLYIGNGPEANGIYVHLSGLDTMQDPLTLRYVQRQVHRPVTASQTSDYWMERTRAWVRAHPWRTLNLLAWKLVLFWNRLSIPQVEGFETSAHATVLRTLPFWSRFELFPLGLFGAGAALFTWLRRGSRIVPAATAGPGGDGASHTASEVGAQAGGTDRTVASEPREVLLLLAACTLVYSVSIALFFITDRYRVAVLPWLVILAVYALAVVADVAADRDRRRRLLVLLPVMALCFWFTSPARLAIDQRRMRRDLHVHMALRYAKAQLFAGALREYAAALDLDPRDPETRDGMARMLSRAGQDSLAIVQLTSLLQDAPGYASGWYNLGNAYRRQHRSREAVAAYHHALALEPARESTWDNLGLAYRALGDTARAAESYRRALSVVPNHEQSLNNLAVLRAEQGDARSAEAGFRAAVAANPRYVPALTNLARLLGDSGRQDEALQLWQRILMVEPENDLALRMTRQLHGPAPHAPVQARKPAPEEED